MALKKKEAYLKLLEIVREKTEHQDYERVCELANKYKPLMTGEHIDHLLRQFNIREDDIMFEQRKQLTQLVTPAIISTLMNPQRKVPQIRPLIKEAGYTKKGEADTKNKDALVEMINSFNGKNKDVDFYMKEKITPISNHDPNAWVLITFEPFNNVQEQPKPYPVIIYSNEAVMYEFSNTNELDYLTVRIAIKYEKYTVKNSPRKDKTYGDGLAYTLHAADDQVKFVQVDINSIRIAPKLQLFAWDGSSLSLVTDVDSTASGIDYYYRYDDTRLFKINFYEPKSKVVPAYRLGYLYDPETEYRTCINAWHAALSWLMKSVKAISELDLSSALHVFPQKIAYVQPCTGYKDPSGHETECNNGYTPDGVVCKACNGTGHKIHRSAQDAIILKMPKLKEEAFNLNELVTYVTLPMNIVEWLDKWIDKCTLKCQQAIFNSDMFAVNTTVATATEKKIDLQSVDDALVPFKAFWSALWEFCVTQDAIYLSLDTDLVVKHQFPKRNGFETPSDLLNQMQAAKTAGASNFVIEELDDALLQQLYADRPYSLKAIITKRMFDPLGGKSLTDVAIVLNSQFMPKRYKVLGVMLNIIFGELERESFTKSQKSFYDLPFVEQEKQVNEKVDAILKMLLDEVPELPALNQPFADPNAPPPAL